jgi:hypothetical protein
LVPFFFALYSFFFLAWFGWCFFLFGWFWFSLLDWAGLVVVVVVQLELDSYYISLNLVLPISIFFLSSLILFCGWSFGIYCLCVCVCIFNLDVVHYCLIGFTPLISLQLGWIYYLPSCFSKCRQSISNCKNVVRLISCQKLIFFKKKLVSNAVFNNNLSFLHKLIVTIVFNISQCVGKIIMINTL